MEQNTKSSKIQKYLRLIAKIHLTPAQSIVVGFALMILIGAILLSLPFASRSGESVGFLDALFTATSANCVTGLVVVNTMESWTVFGKLVILTLIQFGGLGYMDGDHRRHARAAPQNYSEGPACDTGLF